MFARAETLTGRSGENPSPDLLIMGGRGARKDGLFSLSLIYVAEQLQKTKEGSD